MSRRRQSAPPARPAPPVPKNRAQRQAAVLQSVAREKARREQALRAKARRRRVALFVISMMSLAVLSVAGIALGKGIGLAVAAVKQYLPSDPLPLAAQKASPPQPVDMSGPATPCPASSLALQLVADRASLTQGEGVGFEILVTHVGRYPCLVNGGDENLRLRVQDAAGQVLWSNRDCVLPGHKDLLLGPQLSAGWVAAWDGRSGTCTDGQPVMPSGAVQIIASLSDVVGLESAPVGIRIVEPPPPPPPPPPEPEVDPISELVAEPISDPIADPIAEPTAGSPEEPSTEPDAEALPDETAPIEVPEPEVLADGVAPASESGTGTE